MNFHLFQPLLYQVATGSLSPGEISAPLRGVLSRHAAVWISATMFAFMHVAVLPSVPYLIVLGAVLAYLRLASGTLLLPILIHFAHNLVVLLIECGMN